MTTPTAAWQHLLTSNLGIARNVGGHLRRQAEEPPPAAVFSCADSGLPTERVFGPPGQSLINVSTWAHVIDAGVLGTLEYATEIMRAPLIVVLGHERCHAVAAALRALSDADLPDGATRDAVVHALWSIMRSGPNRDIREAAAAHTVDTGYALVQRSPTLARLVESNTCAIVCATTNATGERLRVHDTIGSVEALGSRSPSAADGSPWSTWRSPTAEGVSSSMNAIGVGVQSREAAANWRNAVTGR